MDSVDEAELGKSRTVAETALYGQSYLLQLPLKIRTLEQIAPYLVRFDKETVIFNSRYSDVTESIEDMLEKLGFMALALSYIKGGTGPTFKIVKYHTYNFIYHAKSFLDAVAVCLNKVLRLGFEGRHVDFRNEKFVQKVQERSKHLRELSNTYGRWIRRIISYRDPLIHRKTIPILFAFDKAGKPTDDDVLAAKTLFVPKKPVTFIEHVRLLQQGKFRARQELEDVAAFCEEGLSLMHRMLENVLEEVADTVCGRPLASEQDE